MDVQYNRQHPLAGGHWQLRVDSAPLECCDFDHGLYSMVVFLRDIELASVSVTAPTGLINGGRHAAGFREIRIEPVFDPSSGLPAYALSVSQRPYSSLENDEDQSLFYGVGTLPFGVPGDTGLPKGQPSLFNRQFIPWADDPAFGTSVKMLSGTFAQGQQPNFARVSGGGHGFVELFTSLPIGKHATGTIAADFFPQVHRTTNLNPADFNEDGYVDAADYTVWRNRFPSPTLYRTWKMNFGAAPESPAAASLVVAPEPATGLLLGVSLMMVHGIYCRCRRWRRRRPSQPNESVQTIEIPMG